MKRLAAMLLALLMLCGCGEGSTPAKEGWNRYEFPVYNTEDVTVSIDLPEAYVVFSEKNVPAEEEIARISEDTEAVLKKAQDNLAQPPVLACIWAPPESSQYDMDIYVEARYAEELKYYEKQLGKEGLREIIKSSFSEQFDEVGGGYLGVVEGERHTFEVVSLYEKEMEPQGFTYRMYLAVEGETIVSVTVITGDKNADDRIAEILDTIRIQQK